MTELNSETSAGTEFIDKTRVSAMLDNGKSVTILMPEVAESEAVRLMAEIIQQHQAEIIRLEALVKSLTNELRTVTAKRVTAQGGVAPTN